MTKFEALRLWSKSHQQKNHEKSERIIEKNQYNIGNIWKD